MEDSTSANDWLRARLFDAMPLIDFLSKCQPNPNNPYILSQSSKSSGAVIEQAQKWLEEIEHKMVGVARRAISCTYSVRDA